MRKLMCVLLCFIIIFFFIGCGGRSENELSKDVRAISENELPKNARSISAKWQDNQLLYATSNGLFAYSPSDGRTENLMSDDTFVWQSDDE